MFSNYHCGNELAAVCDSTLHGQHGSLKLLTLLLRKSCQRQHHLPDGTPNQRDLSLFSNGARNAEGALSAR